MTTPDTDLADPTRVTEPALGEPARGREADEHLGRGYAWGAQDYGTDVVDSYRAARFGAFWSLLVRLADPVPLHDPWADRYRTGGRKPVTCEYRDWTDNGESYRWENANGHWAIVPTALNPQHGVAIVPVPGVNRYYGGTYGTNGTVWDYALREWRRRT